MNSTGRRPAEAGWRLRTRYRSRTKAIFHPHKNYRNMKAKNYFHPRIDRLEERCLMTGNVSARMDGDTLVVRGDNFDNAVEIRRVEDGQIAVQGRETLVNGEVFSRHSNVRSILIYGNGGDDQILVGVADGLKTSIAGELDIRLGDGDDHLTIENTSVRVLTIRDGESRKADKVELKVVEIQAALAVYGSNSRDEFTARTLRANGRVELRLGGEADEVSLYNSRIAQADFGFGSGDDHLYLWGTKIETGTINGSSGVDTIVAGTAKLRRVRELSFELWA